MTHIPWQPPQTPEDYPRSTRRANRPHGVLGASPLSPYEDDLHHEMDADVRDFSPQDFETQDFAAQDFAPQDFAPKEFVEKDDFAAQSLPTNKIVNSSKDNLVTPAPHEPASQDTGQHEHSLQAMEQDFEESGLDEDADDKAASLHAGLQATPAQQPQATPNAPVPQAASMPPALAMDKHKSSLPDSNPSISPEDLEYIDVVDAALARQPSSQARYLSLAVGLFFLVLIIWASLAKVDEVTRAEGQVISSQRTQAIQNLEGGILRAILVREGQIIEKDAPLARLDNELAESNYRDATNKSFEHRAAILRLEAELENRPPEFPEELLKAAPQIIQDQQSAYTARKNQRESELMVLQSQAEQREQDVEEQLSRKRNLDRNLELAIEQRNTALPLMQRKNFSRMEFLGLEQKVATLQGDVDSLASSLPKSQSAAQEAKQRITFRKAELDAAITEEINKRRNELASLRETLSAGSDRVTRTELRSPVRGTIKQIYINSIGGVVKPGESIMDIVPLDDSLLVEAKVRPADVAFLHPSQRAMIKFSAYDFGVYGGLEATLEQISADTIEDKKGEVYYLAKLRTKKNSITYHNEALPIIPGMLATVDILTGQKTVLDYLLKPILKARQNALRER